MPRQIQVTDMDEELRNSLWDVVHEALKTVYERHHQRSFWVKAARSAAIGFFKEPVDSVPGSDAQAHRWLRQRFLTITYLNVYDLIEFFAENIGTIKHHPGDLSASAARRERAKFMEDVNKVLVEELSAYRFISGVLRPISDAVEVEAIEEAASGGGEPADHIRAALTLLGQKPSPDYRNSIKESISAVETAVNQLAGTKATGVADAIGVLQRKTEIHPALLQAITKLYGYTSDKDGIRHAIMDRKEISLAEAKFMLVACSAFVNFLTEQSAS